MAVGTRGALGLASRSTTAHAREKVCEEQAVAAADVIHIVRVLHQDYGLVLVAEGPR